MSSHLLKALQRPLFRKVQTGTGFTSEPDGQEVADIELEIDLDAIARELGRKAMKSKNGRSVYLGGLVRARVVNRRRVA